jgi:hypothetical protein
LWYLNYYNIYCENMNFDYVNFKDMVNIVEIFFYSDINFIGICFLNLGLDLCNLTPFANLITSFYQCS